MGLRIIGGELKRKKISTLEGSQTRPTSDRVRESLFNILSHRVQDKTVLDLFAGTGALGIESLSRGASSCVFVDSNKKAVQLIKKNIASCNLDQKSRVFLWDIRKNLNCLQSMAPIFDLVFLDPPYNMNLVSAAFTHLHSAACIKNDALIVAEHSVKEPVYGPHAVFQVLDQRTYGKTSLSFFSYKI